MGVLSLLEHLDLWAQLHSLGSLCGEPGEKLKMGLKSSLLVCWSSIGKVSWWQLIPTLLALEGSLRVSQVLINFVDPHHHLQTCQVVGEY